MGKYRDLGRDCGEAVLEVVRGLKRGVTERQVRRYVP